MECGSSSSRIRKVGRSVRRVRSCRISSTRGQCSNSGGAAKAGPYARGAEQIFAERHECVGKTGDLKSVAIADEPNLHLSCACPAGGNLMKSGEARYLVERPIDTLRPTARSGKGRLPHSLRLEVRDLRRMVRVANIEDP